MAFVTWWLLVYWATCVGVSTAVVLRGLTYQGIVVALPPKTPADTFNTLELAQELQDLFSNASAYLYRSTGRRAYFGQVTLLVPKSWGDPWETPDGAAVQPATLERPDQANFIVTTRQSVFADRPYTLQHAGCGQEGLVVHVPHGFLKQDQPVKDRYGDPGRLLVREWAHYRYGVFDEHGYPGDPRYPLYYNVPGKPQSSPTVPTTCSNMPFDYYAIDKNKKTCSLSLNDQGRPRQPQCYVVPKMDGANNNKATSSIMFQQFLPMMSEFCRSGDTRYPHNEAAPSKHNALCFERGTGDVILGHSDFISGLQGNQAQNTKPSFTYVQQGPLRVVVVIDMSVNMFSWNRMEFVAAAVNKFISVDLPDGTELGIVGFADTAEQLLVNKVLNSDTARKEAIQKIPQVKPSSKACVRCGVEEALKVLNNEDSASSKGGLVLLVTRGQVEQDLLPLSSTLIQRQVRLEVIVYAPLNLDLSDSAMDILASRSGGRVHLVTEDVITTETGVPQVKMTTLANLFLAFSMILSGNLWEADYIPVQLAQEEVATTTKKLKYVFNVDASYAGGMQMLLLGEDFHSQSPSIFKMNLTLTAPDGTEHNINDTTLEQKKSWRAFVANVRNNVQVGPWTLTADMVMQTGNPYVAMVTAFRSRDETTIELTSWISQDFSQVDPTKSPLIIYAHLRQGLNPVRNAKVVATIRPSNPPSASPIVLNLLDDGLGDPDVTKWDGIYSRYFSEFTTVGRYSIVINATGNEQTEILTGGSGQRWPGVTNPALSDSCCGSQFPDDSKRPTGTFSRQTGFGSFHLNISRPDSDIFPPSRILDLAVDRVDHYRRLVVLTWSAPGGNYDQGHCDHYELAYFLDRSRARTWDKSAGHLVEAPSPPSEYGVQQFAVVSLAQYRGGGEFFFAVRPYDEVQNAAAVSNIVQAHLEPEPLTTSVPPITVVPPPDELIAASVDVIAVIVTVGLIFLLINLVAYFVTSKQRAKQLDKISAGRYQPLISPKRSPLQDTAISFTKQPYPSSTSSSNEDVTIGSPLRV